MTTPRTNQNDLLLTPPRVDSLSLLLWAVLYAWCATTPPLLAQEATGEAPPAAADVKKSSPAVPGLNSSSDTPQPPSQQELKARVASLIEQLGDDNYHTRVNARWELERIGLEAFEELQAARMHPNPEIERAAQYIIESQNVSWWLDNDSVAVRTLLKNYNGLNNVERQTCFQQLANLATPDALLALARLARFEINEGLSKAAALSLMEQMARVTLAGVEQNSLQNSSAWVAADSLSASQTQLTIERGTLDSPGTVSQSEAHSVDSIFLRSLLFTLGDSQRTSVQWLKTLSSNLLDHPSLANTASSTTDSLESAAVRLRAEPLTAWASFAKEEHRLASEEGREAIETTRRFYRWLGSWLTFIEDREAALNVTRSSLDLVSNDEGQARKAAEWMLESQLPELVEDLQQQYPELFMKSAKLSFLLAKSYLELGASEKAELQATAASESIRELAESIGQDHSKALAAEASDELEINWRKTTAIWLSERGMFRWARREYAAILSLNITVSMEWSVRLELSHLMWQAGDYQQAATTLEPVLALPDRQDQPATQALYIDRPTLLANYHFYAGLAAINSGDTPAAGKHLQQAMDVEGDIDNPDILIALKQVAHQEPFATQFRVYMDAMVSDYRTQVLDFERRLIQANLRERRGIESILSEYCNQLAWLLAKCNESPREALKLSLRSLDLEPDKATYLDTLARCLFANERYEEAVQTQRKALRFSPNDLQMQAQLQEFQSALETQQNQAAGKPASSTSPPRP